MKSSTVLSLSCILTFIWVGFLAAISFMEAPVKFTAPSLTLAVGLDVGRHVFAALNKVEWVFILLSAILVLANKYTSAVKLVWGGIFLILCLQTFWLLPALDARALIYINGGTPPASYLHLVYIIVESFKLIALIAVGILQVVALKKVMHDEVLAQVHKTEVDIFA
jgi:hypothetical protein